MSGSIQEQTFNSLLNSNNFSLFVFILIKDQFLLLTVSFIGALRFANFNLQMNNYSAVPNDLNCYNTALPLPRDRLFCKYWQFCKYCQFCKYWQFYKYWNFCKYSKFCKYQQFCKYWQVCNRKFCKYCPPESWCLLVNQSHQLRTCATL